MIYLDSLSLAFIGIPKCGTKTVRRYVEGLGGRAKTQLHAFNPNLIPNGWDGVAVIRPPIDRAMSMWSFYVEQTRKGYQRGPVSKALGHRIMEHCATFDDFRALLGQIDTSQKEWSLLRSQAAWLQRMRPSIILTLDRLDETLPVLCRSEKPVPRENTSEGFQIDRPAYAGPHLAKWAPLDQIIFDRVSAEGGRLDTRRAVEGGWA